MLRVLFNFIMGIGIFAKTFIRPTLEQVLDCVYEQGIKNIQFNMSCAGLAPLPDFIDPVTSKRIFHETERRDIKISAVSGTFNMIHPNKLEREIGLARLNTLATASKEMGASVITLCTGTRDPDNMWRKHPGNREGSAWKDLLACMETALGIAENHNVMLAFEPEQANVVDSAEKGKRLLNEMKSNKLKVVFDAANLFHKDNISHMKQTMENAFHLLNDAIIMAHAKDININKNELRFVAAGEGILDYDTYLKLLHEYRFSGALILHDLGELQVRSSVQFIRQKLELIN